MIEITELTEKDIGRNVTYHREYCTREYGRLNKDDILEAREAYDEQR